jgi:hypothetical protein
MMAEAAAEAALISSKDIRKRPSRRASEPGTGPRRLRRLTLGDYFEAPVAARQLAERGSGSPPDARSRSEANATQGCLLGNYGATRNKEWSG